jgi:inner membrane protein
MHSMVLHPAVPLALPSLLPLELCSPSVIFLGVVSSVLPDLDVVGFRFGVPYGHFLGHRWLSHSIASAVFLSACVAWLLPLEPQPVQAFPLVLFGFLFLSTLSHGLLDAMTSGGLGVVFFAPFENHRYFFPWHPIRVSPISVSRFFSATGLQVLHSEPRWVWLPEAAVAGLPIFLAALERVMHFRLTMLHWRYGT